ncbi:MAG: ABC transporter substrate-binding protein [Candidatus Thorarchaeota archaeon]
MVKRAFSYSLVLSILGILLLCSVVSALPVQFIQSEDGGAYLDKIVYKSIGQEDQQILDLMDNEIDIIGDMISPSFFQQLMEASNIEVANLSRNGYGKMTINCAKYPYSITAFRRALAFAVDKRAICDDIWGGFAKPLDSPIPDVNPFSIEGQLSYSYYESNIALGNSLLDEAGFLDTDADGYRNSPDGSFFDVLIECADSSSIAIEVGAYFADALRALSIDAVSQPTDFYEYLNRVFFHGDYDIVFLGRTQSNFDVDWLADEYWSEYCDEPYYNFPNWSNASFDSYRDTLLHSVAYDEVYTAASEMQKIWIYECPEIIAYQNIQMSAYRNDRFEGFTNDVVEGVPGWWTNFQTHLINEGIGIQGGTLRISTPINVDSFNFMALASFSFYAQKVSDNLWDSLLRRSPTGEDLPWIAESYSAEVTSGGGTRFTFNLVQNATWTDGVPITGEDVAFTLNYYKDASGNPYGTDLSEMTAAYSPTTYFVIVEFSSQSFWHLHTCGYKPIIPRHIFQEIPPDEWYTWNPQPPSEPMVTSGPFNVTNYVLGEFTELSRNYAYFRSADSSSEKPTEPFEFLLSVSGIITIGSVFVIIVVAVLILRSRTPQQSEWSYG